LSFAELDSNKYASSIVKHFLPSWLSLSNKKAVGYDSILSFIAIQRQLKITVKIQNIFELANKQAFLQLPGNLFRQPACLSLLFTLKEA
jgi:hypothetical protein